jgi:hypothetical protein
MMGLTEMSAEALDASLSCSGNEAEKNPESSLLTLADRGWSECAARGNLLGRIGVSSSGALSYGIVPAFREGPG